MDDAAIDRADYTSPGVPPTLFATNAPVGGKYCTNSGKCITFNEKADPSGGQIAYTTVTSSEIPDPYGFLAFCHSGGDPGCPTGSQYGERGELYYKHLGAFELMDSTAMNSITCGTDSVGRTARDTHCVNGQVVRRYGSDDDSMSGATYNMGPLYAYFPVNAKIKDVVDSGYFDKDYVAQANKQKPVDTSRPFLISRDKSLYKTTSVNVQSFKTPNPFIPESLKKDNGTLVPMKPAPSDETAYYLVEDPLDWNSLPEFTIVKNNGKSDKSDAGNSSKADAQPKITPQNATPDQITAAAEKGDDSLIAGEYCSNDGHCLDLSKTGQLTGGSQEAMLGIDSTQLTLSGASEDVTAARNVKPDSQFLEFRGSVNDYLCKNGTAGQACKNSYHTTPEVDRWPAHILYVFKGSDISSWYAPNAMPPVQGFMPNYSDGYDRTPAKTDRAYIYPVGWHMTVSPFDDGAYYFQG